jgi:hypothetical protein
VWAVTPAVVRIIPSLRDGHRFCSFPGTSCQATISQSLRDGRRTPNAERQTPNAKRQTPNASRDPLARFGESIEGDGEDDNDADNDLLDVRRYVHQHETVQ